MKVRFEEASDHDAIRVVHATSFPTVVEADLVDALRSAGRLLVSVVAEERGRVVGHVAFSPIALLGTTDGVGLGPLAVLAAFRRRGIGERIIRDGLEVCRTRRFGFVVVLGDPSYYQRFGFMVASDWGLRDEFGGGAAFQALELRPGAIPPGGGVVHYSSEFAAVEEPNGSPQAKPDRATS